MIKMIKMYHNPVLLKESIIGLNINPNGIYVDATFGGGGHSTEILNNLNSSGRLIAFDQDQDAIENKILFQFRYFGNSVFKNLIFRVKIHSEFFWTFRFEKLNFDQFEKKIVIDHVQGSSAEI